jgi:hypothetical protein
MGFKGGSCTRQTLAVAREEFEENIRFDGGIVKAELFGHLHTGSEGGGGDVRERAGAGGGQVPVNDEGGLGQRHWFYLNIMSREHLLKRLCASVCVRAREPVLPLETCDLARTFAAADPGAAAAATSGWPSVAKQRASLGSPY